MSILKAAVCLCLCILAAPSLALSQTDPLWSWIDTSSWPDAAGVQPVYGTITVKVNVNGSQTDDTGTITKIDAHVIRTESLSKTSSTAFYQLSGTITIDEPDEDENGMPCRHIATQSLSLSYEDPAFDSGYAMTVSKKLGLARFTIASLMLPGFTLSTVESGCNAGPSQTFTFNGPTAELYGLDWARVPYYSTQNTAFARAAQAAENAGQTDFGPLFDGGDIEGGWTGSLSTGNFSVPLINGYTQPVWDLIGDEDAEEFPGLLEVSWALSGAPIPVDNELDDPCNDTCGSVVGIQNQNLGETVPITGTPYFLHYSSDRAAGRTGANPVATADALQFGGWTLSAHHVFDPSLAAYCVDGSCSAPSSEPKALFLGDGSTRSDAKVQSAVQANGNYYLTSKDGSEVYVFNSTGQHLQTLRPMTGAAIYTFGYDAAGSLTSVTDAAGNMTKIDRDANENPLDIVSPFGQTTTLAVDGNGYLSSISDPGGNAVGLTHNPMGLLTSMTDANGGVFNFQYDSSGLLLQDSDPVGGQINLSRTTANGNYTVTHTTALQRTSTYATGFASQAGASTTQNIGVTTPAGQQSTSSSSQMSGLLSQTTKLANGVQLQYTTGPDPRFGIQSPVDSGVTITMGGLTMSSVNGRTAATSGAAGPFNLTSQTDTSTINGRTYTSVFTSADGTYRNVSPQGRTLNTTLDTLERLSATQSGALSPATFTYDSKGRPTSTGQGGRTATFAYDANGRISSLTTPIGQQTFTYDAAGNPASFTWDDGRTIGYTHDANRNRTSVTPPGGAAHLFTYTPVNLLASYTPPSVPGAGPTTYSYNVDRQLTSASMPDGQTVAYTYDNFGRVTSLQLPTETINYTYDPATGQRISAAISGGETLNFTFNGLLTTSAAWSGPVTGTIARTYDNNFWETALTINGGSPIKFIYDNDGLATAAGAETIGRRPDNGAVTQTSLGVITDAETYDSFGALTAYTAKQNGAALYNSQYTFDNAGRITAKSETIGSASNNWAYAYDVSGRLTSVMLNGSPSATYSYDSNSNRTGGAYDAQDRLLANSSATYTYSPNGALASKTTNGQTTTYTYDELGNLIAATLPGGAAVGYIVDSNNRRVGVTVNGALTTGYLYDGTHLVAQLDGKNSVVSQFVFGTRANVPDYILKGGATYRILSDHLGSPRLIVDASTGTVMEQIDYGAFGEILTDTNPGFQPFGFGGGLHDPSTGLLRFGARDYSPDAGRWTAKDPIRFAGGDTNLYAYAFNDPVNRLDLSGLAPASILDCRSLQDLEDYGKKWIQDNYSTVPLGPVSIDTQNGTASVGGSAGVQVEGQDAISVSAQAGVGIPDLPSNLDSPNPSGPVLDFFATLGIKFPALTGTPVIGPIFQTSHTGTLSVGIASWLTNLLTHPTTSNICFNNDGEVTSCGGQ